VYDVVTGAVLQERRGMLHQHRRGKVKGNHRLLRLVSKRQEPTEDPSYGTADEDSEEYVSDDGERDVQLPEVESEADQGDQKRRSLQASTTDGTRPKTVVTVQAEVHRKQPSTNGNQSRIASEKAFQKLGKTASVEHRRNREPEHDIESDSSTDFGEHRRRRYVHRSPLTSRKAPREHNGRYIMESDHRQPTVHSTDSLDGIPIRSHRQPQAAQSDRYEKVTDYDYNRRRHNSNERRQHCGSDSCSDVADEYRSARTSRDDRAGEVVQRRRHESVSRRKSSCEDATHRTRSESVTENRSDEARKV
jgi:hypothetical protein